MVIGGGLTRGSGNQMPDELAGGALWLTRGGLALEERRWAWMDNGRAAGGTLRQVVGGARGDAEDGLSLQWGDVLREPGRLGA